MPKEGEQGTLNPLAAKESSVSVHQSQKRGKQVDAALLLSDLCRSFNLDEEQHDYVLGESGAQHVLQVLETRITVRTSLPLAQQVATPEIVETVTTFLPEEGL